MINSSNERSYPEIIDRKLIQIRFTLEETKVQGITITNLSNIRYLTGFRGSAATLFVFNDELHFVTDDRYKHIEEELYPLPNLKIHFTRDLWNYAKETNLLDGIKSLAFEADQLPYGDAVFYRNILRPIKYKPTEEDVKRFNMPKDPIEIGFIKESCRIAEETFEHLMKTVKSGMTEQDLANEIICHSRKIGSEGEAFNPIVLAGERTTIVHGIPSDRKIKKNEMVLVDFGFKHKGFSSDITRCFVIGKPTKEMQKTYEKIYSAQEAAIKAIRPGVNGQLVDKAARNIIEQEGWGDYFQHGTGHGIGIDVHESPIISHRKDDQMLPEDCVVTIEPGVYLPGKWGIRIEDDILVTKSGAERLTKAPEELPVL